MAEASTTMAFGKLPYSFLSKLPHELGGVEVGSDGLAATDPGEPLLARGEQLVLLDQPQDVVTHREPLHARPSAELLMQLRREVLDLKVAHSMTLAC